LKGFALNHCGLKFTNAASDRQWLILFLEIKGVRLSRLLGKLIFSIQSLALSIYGLNFKKPPILLHSPSVKAREYVEN
jgi:hypothetical protein